MLDLGTPMPDVKLPDTEGRVRALADFDDAPALVVGFICRHCPYVRHVKDGLIELSRELTERGAAFVGIASNDWDSYPDDAPELMAAEGYPFAVLVDESQEVAKAFSASCTPDFYVFDADRSLVYRGQMDAARPGNDEPVTGADLRAAVEAVLAGDEVSPDQRPSVGCSIKWRPGNEPNYAA